MPDRPDIPEEMVEQIKRAWEEAALRYSGDEDRVARALIDSIAPALRKQGAEEAAERWAAKLQEAQVAALQATENTRDAEAERDQALAKGAEEERVRLRECVRAVEPPRSAGLARTGFKTAFAAGRDAALAGLDTPEEDDRG
jgi:sugar-specific transcriptional regulator TrmB